MKNGKQNDQFTTDRTEYEANQKHQNPLIERILRPSSEMTNQKKTSRLMVDESFTTNYMAEDKRNEI